MNQIKIFKILTYVLTIPTAFIGLLALSILPIALMSLQTALMAFILVCVVIYITCSLIFLNKTITQRRETKKIIKDLLKINGIITVIFCVICLIDFTSMITQPTTVTTAINKAFAENPNIMPPQVTKELMVKMVWVLFSFVGIYSVLLLLHYLLCFKLRKQFDGLFTND